MKKQSNAKKSTSLRPRHALETVTGGFKETGPHEGTPLPALIGGELDGTPLPA